MFNGGHIKRYAFQWIWTWDGFCSTVHSWSFLELNVSGGWTPRLVLPRALEVPEGEEFPNIVLFLPVHESWYRYQQNVEYGSFSLVNANFMISTCSCHPLKMVDFVQPAVRRIEEAARTVTPTGGSGWRRERPSTMILFRKMAGATEFERSTK